MSEFRLCYFKSIHVPNAGNRGIHIEFDNGMTASIQFSHYNYCDSQETEDSIIPTKAKNCEIACYDKDGKWYTSEYDSELNDDVKGYVSTEEIPAFLEWCKNYKF